MVERGKHHIVPDLAAFAYGHASVVLKMAAGIDEHAFPDSDVFSEIGIERRKDAECVGNAVAEKFGKDVPHLFRGTVCGVQAECDFPGFSAHLVHQLVYFFCVKRFARPDVILEFFECHKKFSFLMIALRLHLLLRGLPSILPPRHCLSCRAV